ncbi:MAG: class I SAM-dependent methyltransferase [Bacteroidota bacterium]|nr:class I SAM-dependent methyltransferase [Bacteroidota bacterium]
MPPESPLTKTNNTSLEATFLSSDIIGLYKYQLDIDVSRFFTGKQKFYLYKDNDTGYRFYYPEGLDGDGKFYEALQKKLGDDYYHEWKFENQLAYDYVQVNDKVLDIGCGVGNFLNRIKEKTQNVFGLELNENAIAKAKSKGLTVYNELIQQHAIEHKEFYDVVCSFQVLEHVYDVKTFLESSLKTLKPKGKLIIGVPNNEPYFLGYDKYATLNLPPHHMGLWNKKVFEKVAPLFNLKIIDVQYDIDGRVTAEAYTRAKYITGIKSIAGKHSTKDKIILSLAAAVTLPLTIAKKIIKGLNGSHIAIVFKKE